jgi:hypothetical protein
LGPEGFPKFWDRCGKTGGAGFAALDAITAERIDQPEPPQPKKDEEERQNEIDVKPWAPTKESLNSRDGKTIGISRGDMRAMFLGLLPCTTRKDTLTFLQKDANHSFTSHTKLLGTKRHRMVSVQFSRMEANL